MVASRTQRIWFLEEVRSVNAVRIAQQVVKDDTMITQQTKRESAGHIWQYLKVARDLSDPPIPSGMPRRGLEPPREYLFPTSTSSWRVCQFRHLGLCGRKYRQVGRGVDMFMVARPPGRAGPPLRVLCGSSR